MLSHLKMGFDINFQRLVSNNNQKDNQNGGTKFHFKKLKSQR